MSAATGTRIFGIKLGVDPKIIVGALLAVALLLFFLHGRGDEEGATVAAPNTAAAPSILPVPAMAPSRAARKRGRVSAAALERGAIRIRPVDATRGDIDPTLRIDMLTRLQHVPEPGPGRSLFEIGEAMPTAAEIQKRNQTIHPGPIGSQAAAAVNAPPAVAGPPHVNIPLKFYGFAKAARRATVNRGLFLDGDNVVVAKEGDLIGSRYRVVTLTAQDARMEDTQLKQSQTLPVEPQALPQ